MFYYEEAMPAEGEIVAIRVDELQEYGVAVTLLEYDAKGVVFANELSKKRIRSMKEVVRVGQETAATITRVDPVNKSVDLSIRVCSPEEIVKVLDDYGRHKAVFNLVKRVASLTGAEIRTLFEQVVWPLTREKRDVYEAFVTVNDPTVDPASVLGSDHPYVDVFKSAIAERLPKPTFTATHDQRLVCTDCLNAPEKLTNALNAVAQSGIQVWVIAPPMYRFVATDINEAAAKKRLEEACIKAQELLV
jgi:translation initiation factor 2 alpha subunit (eIF-2alpha)